MKIPEVFCCIFVSLVLCHGSSFEDYFSQDHLSMSYSKTKLTTEYTSNSGKKVFVFDGMLSYSLLMASRVYFSCNDEWRYVLFDKYVARAGIALDHGNGIPWKSWQNPTVISDTRIGQTLKALVTTVSSLNLSMESDSSKSDLQLVEIYSAILRRGDVTQLYADFEHSATGSAFSAVIYTNTIWRKNSYGEILFYEDQDDFDAFAVVSPHFGRVVIWDSSIRYLPRPPSNTELSGQYMIFAQFHSDPKVVFQKRTHFDKYLHDVKESRKNTFVCTEFDSVPTLDMNKHVTLRRFNKAGETVAVFDGLFDKKDLDDLRTYTVKYGEYFYDDQLDLTSDNVQWIAGFEVEKFVSSKFWPIVKQVAAFVSGVDTWYPYDIACNLIRSSDHTRFHLDTSHEDEQEMTFLVYLSPNWTAANYGETAFMEFNYDDPENDYVAEVVPLYGRAVIFGGNFPHSAHPPSPDYAGPRYTFVVKLSINKYEAVMKTFDEEMRHSPEYIVQIIKEIKADPDLFAKKQKISIVTSYLEGRQVMETIQSRPKTKDNILEAMTFNKDNKKIENLLRYFGSGEVALDKEKQNLIFSMINHYGIKKHLKEINRSRNDAANGQDEDDSSWEDSAEKRIESWRKICADDADCLQGYLALFLKQREKFNHEILQQLLSII